MYPLWQELDADAMHAGVQLAAAELLLTGATTSADFVYLYPDGRGDLLDVEVAAARAIGLRLHVVRGCTPILESGIAVSLAAILGIDAIRLTESRAEIVTAQNEPSAGTTTRHRSRCAEWPSGRDPFRRRRAAQGAPNL
jgi:cytosine/adenosine deaminase-related metal-dependent hydrolase